MIFEKFPSLEKINNDCFDKVSLIEIKLNNAIRDLQNSQYKYDKIYIDNLIVKGYVGPSAQYKTMSDYILNNIKNYKNLSDSFKLVTNEFKDYKKEMIICLKKLIFYFKLQEKVVMIILIIKLIFLIMKLI